MNYIFEKTIEMEGVLTSLRGSEIVEVPYMKLDNASTRKLQAVLRCGSVTRDNQDLHISTIIIKQEHLDTFKIGQSSVVRNGNSYVITTNQRNPLRFKANMNTLVTGLDGLTYACTIQIGNIDFDLQGHNPEIDDGDAVFSNVSAVIYPTGEYKAVVVQDE